MNRLKNATNFFLFAPFLFAAWWQVSEDVGSLRPTVVNRPVYTRDADHNACFATTVARVHGKWAANTLLVPCTVEEENANFLALYKAGKTGNIVNGVNYRTTGTVGQK